MENEVFITTITKVWMGEDGIGRSVVLPNVVITLDAAREHIAACTKSSNGKCVPVFFDLRNIKSVDRQAREYFASEAVCKISKASAVLIGSPVSRVIGNFFIGLNKPSYPVKLFTSEKKAIKWLRSFFE